MMRAKTEKYSLSEEEETEIEIGFVQIKEGLVISDENFQSELNDWLYKKD